MCNSTLNLPRSRWGHVSLAIGGFLQNLSFPFRYALSLVGSLQMRPIIGGFHSDRPCHWWVSFKSALSLVGSIQTSPVIGGYPSNLPYHWWASLRPTLPLVDTLLISLVSSGVMEIQYWLLFFVCLLLLVLPDRKYDLVFS